MKQIFTKRKIKKEKKQEIKNMKIEKIKYY
jgi:hypothetical protein